MLRRSITLGVAASLVAAASWWACSNQESASPAQDGGADAGGAGALGGTAATGGTVTSGGKGGTGGSAADAGEWGPSPTWEAIPGTAVGCTFERMTNAGSVRFLKWNPCSWTEDCEQAVFNTTLFGTNAAIAPQSNVADDGTIVRAGITMYIEQNIAVVAGDDGMGLDAIRVAGELLDGRHAHASLGRGKGR